jgi:UPF0042 nucleotide-binding protein
MKIIRIMACGEKHGAPPASADLLLDCRGFINPYYDENLRSLTGADQPVQDFLNQDPAVCEMKHAVAVMVKALLPGLLTCSSYHQEKEILLVFKCTGGMHRSRFFALVAKAAVEELLTQADFGDVQVVMTNRDAGKS